MSARNLALAAAMAAAMTVSLVPASAVVAQAADPAAAQIDAFDASLLDTMKQAKALGVDGRYRKLGPAVEQAFDLPMMTRFAVGPKWSTLSPADQAALTKAFTRLTVASYAHNFDGYGGERFTVDAKVDTRGVDKLVRSHIVRAGDKPVDLAYRMRQGTDGRWKVIDVYYSGSISQLTTQRSDFASSIAVSGQALLQKINALADKLMHS